MEARAQLQAEAHVFSDGLVRIERIVLEHHGDVAILRRELVDDATADLDDRRIVMLSSPAIMRSNVRLAAAGRSDQDNEIAIRDVEGDAVNHLLRAIVLANIDHVD